MIRKIVYGKFNGSFHQGIHLFKLNFKILTNYYGDYMSTDLHYLIIKILPFRLLRMSLVKLRTMPYCH